MKGLHPIIAPICLLISGASLWPEMELLVPSLPTMKVFFNVSEGEIQHLLSANFIGFFLGVLIAGPLCDSLGRRRVVISGLILFLLASFFSVFCDSFLVLIGIRFLQGATVTAPIIGGGALLLELTKGNRQIFWMSLSSATITMCMAIAPLVGAFINEHWGFRGNLWAIFISGLIGFVPFLFFVPETLAKAQRQPFSLPQIKEGYWQLLKNRRFVGLTIVIASLPAAYWIYTGVSSLYMVTYLKIDMASFGRYQGPIVGTFALFSLAITWLHRYRSLSFWLCIGFAAMFVGSTSLVIMSLLNLDNAILTTLLMILFVGGMVPANSLLMPSALNQLPLSLQGSAQSMIQAMRLLIASLGTIVLSLTYIGPFLPVALVMFVLLIASAFLLFRLRNLIAQDKTSDEAILVVAGH